MNNPPNQAPKRKSLSETLETHYHKTIADIAEDIVGTRFGDLVLHKERIKELENLVLEYKNRYAFPIGERFYGSIPE